MSTAAPTPEDGQKEAGQSSEHPKDVPSEDQVVPVTLKESEGDTQDIEENAKADAQQAHQQELDRLLWL